MSLKTDYKNDIYSGMRKYEIIDNTDGTKSLDDKTTYVQNGDIYSAEDINNTNTEVNNMRQDLTNYMDSTSALINKVTEVKNILIPASAWSGSAPYTQTVTVDGSRSTDAPVVGIYLEPSSNPASVKNETKAFGSLDRVVFGYNEATLYCYNRKPSSNFYISIKGV